MKKKIVICGDSYNYGIGCINLHTHPYGVLTANHFDWDLVRLARGSASNYTVFLQGLYAADMADPPHLIILGQTSYDRIEWFAEDMPDNFPVLGHSLLNLNYHLYPPHHEPQMNQKVPMEFHLKGNPFYNPYMLSEQVSGIDDCLNVRKVDPNMTYYQRLGTESSDKLKLIVDYHVKVSDYSIKKNYDIGMLLQAYTYIKRKGINCIVLAEDIATFEKFFDSTDLMYQSWGELSIRFPDKIKSMHTSEEGHKETADRLIQKIKELNLG